MGPCHPLEFQCKFTPKERWMSLLCGYTVGFKPTVILSGYIMFPLNPHWCPTISPLWQGMERLWGSQRNGARKQGATGLMHTWCPVSISVCWLCSVCVCTYTAYTDILMYICQYNPVYIYKSIIYVYIHTLHTSFSCDISSPKHGMTGWTLHVLTSSNFIGPLPR